jgi:hypothetical protein
VVDSVEYRTVADMYGCVYSRKSSPFIDPSVAQSSGKPFKTVPKAEMTPDCAQIVVAACITEGGWNAGT